MNLSRFELSQTNYPLLWKIFQLAIGGTIDKRRLCLGASSGRVLEVGCSVGNMAEGFRCRPEYTYTGLDIDSVAIEQARRDFRDAPDMEFVCSDLRDFARSGRRFDTVLFAGVCHHVEDGMLGEMLDSGEKLLDDGGKVVVIDPVLPFPDDPPLFRAFLRLEKGEYVRELAHLRTLLEACPLLHITSEWSGPVGATVISAPKVARFATFQLSRV